MQKNVRRWAHPPEMGIDSEMNYKAILHTEKGDICINLYEKLVPKTVNNFIFLSNAGYYDKTIFHRIIMNFMAQGGDPTGKGTGGPGYTFDDEIVDELKHNKPGIVSMANAGPNTNGSQFFITHVPTPWLDGKHAIFGEVEEGLDVLFSIPARDPLNPEYPGVVLESVEILTE